MERHRRTSTNLQTNEQLVQARINVYSELVNRANLASKLGTMSYDGNRDIYKALGYPTRLDFQNYYLPKYIRQDIAKAIIDRPVRAAWRGDFTIEEKGSKGTESAIEKAWNEIKLKHKLHTIFMRVDKLTGIGRYGILFLGLNDVTTTEQWATPVTGKSNKLLYIKPLGESSAIINSYESDPKNERYGKPLLYGISITSSKGVSIQVPVHYTRVIHITEDLLEDEVFGTPCLESVFNRLLDLEKIVGGDAEMYWRGARPGYQGKVDKDFTLTPQSEVGLQDQFDEFENNLRRFLLMEGVDVKEMAQQIADPTKNVDAQISMICAVKGVPKRILMGSERGELSSTADREEWNLWVGSRREEHMEPDIIRPVIDRFMELGILPTVKDYIVTWDELFAMSPKEKAEIAQMVANAIRYYTATPSAEYILPKEMFLKKLLGLSDEEVLQAQKLADDLPTIEPPITPQEQAALDQQTLLVKQGGKTPVGGPVGTPTKVVPKVKNPNAGTGKDTVAKKQKV